MFASIPNDCGSGRLAGWALAALATACATPRPENQEAQDRTPRLYRVIVPVRDVERAAGFYAGLFEQKGQRISPGRHYFDLGGTIMAVYDPAADGDPVDEWKHHPNQYVYIAVRDVEASFARARELGAEMLSPRVETMPWGERLFYARDPFGNPICLVDAETLFLGFQPG